MPYEIIGNCVHKKGEKKPLKCYQNHKDALAYLRALEANVNDAKTFDDFQKMFSLPTQQETNYRPAGGSTDHACSNCRFFLRNWEGSPKCHLIENYPEPIESNGVCDRHEIGTPEPLVEEPILVQIVDPMMDMEDSAEMALTVPKTIFQRVKDFAASLRPEPIIEQPAFTVFKTASGRNAWIARHTGKWIDRENEILSEQSHERYVQRVQAGKVNKPELWMWHAKGTKHGEAIVVWKTGGFVLAAGLFDDTAEGERMFQYYQKHSGKIKLSHMFHYPRETKIDGVYNEYNTIEITTLPDGAEAFPYTSFEEIQTMALPEIARNMIAEAGGKEMLDRVLAADSKAEADTKTLDSQGVAWKGYDKYDENLLTEKLSPVDARLKAAEELLAKMADMPATISALNQSVKSLTDQLTDSQKSLTDALAKINELESKQALLTDLKPPASQSSETLLSDREKSLIDKVMEAAKQTDSVSLIDSLMGTQPNIHS